MADKKSALETLYEMLTELFMEDIKICRSEGCSEVLGKD